VAVVLEALAANLRAAADRTGDPVARRVPAHRLAARRDDAGMPGHVTLRPTTRPERPPGAAQNIRLRQRTPMPAMCMSSNRRDHSVTLEVRSDYRAVLTA
jgi:hypothetical protein